MSTARPQVAWSQVQGCSQRGLLGLELALAMQAPVHMQTQTQMDIGITMMSTRMVTPMPMAILMPMESPFTIAAKE